MGSKPSKSQKNKDFQEIGKNSNSQDPSNFIAVNPIHITKYSISGQIKQNFEQDYKKLELLGKGTNGSVYRVQNKITKTYGAMKVISKSNDSFYCLEKRKEEELLNEINILQAMDHINIIKILEIYNNNESFNIVTELCGGGDLMKEAMNKGPFKEPFVAYIMYQIFSALIYCHSQGIIHRDIKLENIFIFDRNRNNYPRIKIGDFGSAKMIDMSGSNGNNNLSMKEKIGSYYSMAPEVLRQNYNEKCDLWSCGVIMYVLLTGHIPFNGKNQEEICQNILLANYDLSGKAFSKVSEPCIDLLRKLLMVNANKRLSAIEALNQKFFLVHKTKDEYNDINNFIYVNKLVNNLKSYRRKSVLQEVALRFLVHNFHQSKNIINACKLFNQIDKENDGKINLNELYLGLRSYIESKNLSNDCKIIFDNLDMNRNGFIEYEEFVMAACDKKDFLEEKVLKYAFNFFDKDESGEINYWEIEELLKDDVKDKEALNENVIQIIKEVDSNLDGKINFNEFKICMNKLIED